MKSELYPGIEFEHTLDGVLFVEYNQFLCEEYAINTPYLIDHADELIKLRDIVIPIKLRPFPKLRKLVAKRTGEDYRNIDDMRPSGIYEWEDRFSRDYHRTIDEMREDDIRLALDIVKKYPEHKDLVIKREMGE